MKSWSFKNVWLVLLLAFGVIPLASAQEEILVGSPGEGYGAYFGTSPNAKIAQGFYLASRSYVTSIQLNSLRCVSDECTIYLTDSLALGRIYSTHTLPYSNETSHRWDVNRVLDPGTYYLVGETTNSVSGNGVFLSMYTGGYIQPEGNLVGLFYLNDTGRWTTLYWLDHEYSLIFLINGLRAISVDVRPSGDCIKIIPDSGGSVSVAILSTDEFDAATVDPTTVRFGATGTEAAPFKDAITDADCDGKKDAVFSFKVNQTGIKCGDTSATLRGKTTAWKDFIGTDSIKTAPCK